MDMKEIWNEKCIFSPSLICLDFLHLENQIRQIENAGIKMLHIDILDGHFSPSMPLGFEVVKQLRNITNLEFDCHLMTEGMDYYVDELLNIGVQQIIFHAETASHIDGLINKIHAAGVKSGVALKPSTPLLTVEYILDKCDTVLLMLINPGYASSAKEAQIDYADRKIRDLRDMIDKRALQTKIEIDGRISPKNIECYGAGVVDIFVCGTTCLSRQDIKGSAAKLFEIRNRII